MLTSPEPADTERSASSLAAQTWPHSDIWASADGSTDGYDIPVLAQMLERGLFNEEVRADLMAAGHKNIERFTHELLLPVWEDLFVQIAGR